MRCLRHGAVAVQAMYVQYSTVHTVLYVLYGIYTSNLIIWPGIYIHGSTRFSERAYHEAHESP